MSNRRDDRYSGGGGRGRGGVRTGVNNSMERGSVMVADEEDVDDDDEGETKFMYNYREVIVMTMKMMKRMIWY